MFQQRKYRTSNSSLVKTTSRDCIQHDHDTIIYHTNSLITHTVDDLDMEMGWLRGRPLLAIVTGGGSSSNEGNRGVSGGVNNLEIYNTE